MSKAKFKISHMSIADLDIEIHHKPIKNLYLRVLSPKGTIVVSSPKYLSQKRIQQFVLSKYDWIVSQQKKIQARNQREEMETDQSLIRLYGSLHPLKVVTSRAQQVVLEEGCVCLYVKPSTPIERYGKLLDAWYRVQLQQQFHPIISRYEPLMSVNVSECRIKKMKTRWGSCNPVAQRIWLNFELVKKPLICLEYVIVHEMVHLLEASHNQRFYRLMDQYMPDWRSHKQLLNEAL